MKILMVASESRPFSKTGGLADVTYSLSLELVKMGEEVSIITPFYRSIKSRNYDRAENICSFVISMSWRRQTATIFKIVENGITFYFVDNEHYFGRDHIYGDNDDHEKFAFFALAVREFL